MRLGAQMSAAGGLYKAFEHGEKAGCESILVFTKSNRQWNAKPITEEDVQLYQAAAEKYAHIQPVAVHASYLINIASPDEALWEKSYQALKDEVARAAAFGIPLLTFHPGSYMNDDPAKVYPIARKRLAEVVGQLKDEGVQVTLRPETMGKSAMLGTLEETIDLARDIDGVLPCIDFAHLHARRGDGSFNTYAEFTTALKLVASGLGRRGLSSLHIHLSGIEYGPKGEKKHLPLAEADLKYEELFQALIDLKAGGRILCESPLMEDDALVMVKTYQRLADQAAA